MPIMDVSKRAIQTERVVGAWCDQNKYREMNNSWFYFAFSKT
jgi:hypothetical protein